MQGVQVEELWSLDPEQFDNLKYVIDFNYALMNETQSNFAFICRPIHGLIFLFKWVPNEEVVGTVVQDSRLDKIFFAKQVHAQTNLYKFSKLLTQT